MNLNQITLPARDIATSARFYRDLGFTQIVDAPHYARFECPDGDATFSLHHAETIPSDTGVVIYFEVEQLDDKVRALQAQGITFFHPPTDERWLWREARLRDPSGNVICLFHAGPNRKYPPWRIAPA